MLIQIYSSTCTEFISIGMPGKSGEDGFDVELEPEGDMPCVICPGGKCYLKRYK